MKFVGDVLLSLLVLGVALLGILPILVVLSNGWDSWRKKRAMAKKGYVRQRIEWPTEMGRRFGPEYSYVRADGRADPTPEHDDRPEPSSERSSTAPDRYGEAHQVERAKYVKVIQQHGGVCMERVCIMPSRRIAPGSYWELAHDHTRGGAGDYLGPAHQECNQAEALGRGATWEGAPLLAELLGRVGYTGSAYENIVKHSREDPWSRLVEAADEPVGGDRSDPWPTQRGYEDDDPWAEEFEQDDGQ